MKKNLIIGAITNYVWGDVEPFFNSFKQANFENTDCVMFVHNMASRTLNKIRECGVKIFQIPSKYKHGCINDCRWEIYRDFLKDKCELYNIIFTADVRDSFFQKDLFKCHDDSKPFLCVALEDFTLTEGTNRSWLTKIYGSEIYETIKNNRIICTGTVLGTCKEFFEFTTAITNEINSDSYEHFRIADQGCGNGIIYHKKMFHDVLKTSTNYDGYIMTIGLTKPEDIKLDANGNIFNGVGEIAAVVHQYDRKPVIIAVAQARYCKYKKFFERIKIRMEMRLNALRRSEL